VRMDVHLLIIARLGLPVTTPNPHARPSAGYRSMLVAIVVITTAAALAIALLPYRVSGPEGSVSCRSAIAIGSEDPAACDGDVVRLLGAIGFGLGAVAVGLLARRLRPPSPYELLDGPVPPSDEAGGDENSV
jgi:hypothetical protein